MNNLTYEQKKTLVSNAAYLAFMSFCSGFTAALVLIASLGAR